MEPIFSGQSPDGVYCFHEIRQMEPVISRPFAKWSLIVNRYIRQMGLFPRNSPDGASYSQAFRQMEFILYKYIRQMEPISSGAITRWG